MEAAKRWPREFAQILPDYKPRLLALLRRSFCMVFSQILGETVFFCEDEHTKTGLVEAGADKSSIYTREELRLLIEQHRRKPITAAELLQIHRARRIFNARIAE